MPPRDPSPELRHVFRSLKLGKLLPTLPERLRHARERKLDPEDVLLTILGDELQRRERQRLSLRALRAGVARWRPVLPTPHQHPNAPSRGPRGPVREE